MRKIQYTFTALTALMVLFACSPERLEETSGPGGQAMVLTALSARNVPDTGMDEVVAISFGIGRCPLRLYEPGSCLAGRIPGLSAGQYGCHL